MRLIPFWIRIPNWSHAPIGYGVTAYSLEDALALITGRGYRLPDVSDDLQVKEDIRYEELTAYVQQHMGPIVVRGMWYPFNRLGE